MDDNDMDVPNIALKEHQERNKSDQWCIETFLRIRPALRGNESAFTYKIEGKVQSSTVSRVT